MSPFSYVGQGRKGKTDFQQELTEVTEISGSSLSSCVKLLWLRFSSDAKKTVIVVALVPYGLNPPLS